MNNDRFNFRAIISVDYYNVDGDEKTVKLLLNDVTPNGGDGIGFSDNTLFIALSKLDLTDEDKERIKEAILEDADCYEDVWFNYWAKTIMQCTGLRDKKGHLIFEGDILEAGGRRYVVCWAHHGFVMRFTPDSASSCPLGSTDLFEIVGNVHDNPINDNVGETK